MLMLVRFPGLAPLHRLCHLSTASLPSPPPLPHRHFSPRSSTQSAIAVHDQPFSSLLHFVQTLCFTGRSEEAHHRLLLLLSSSPLFTNHTYNALVSALLKSNTPLLTLRLLLRLSHVKPLSSISLSTFNKLIHLLSQRFLGHAHRLLLRLHCTGPSPDTATYTIVLNGYAYLGEFAAARLLFDEIHDCYLSPNSLTRSTLIKAALRKRAHLSEAMLLLEQLWLEMQMEKEGGIEESVRNAAFANLIQCLCQEALFHEVFRIAEEMPQGDCIREDFAYSQMIDSVCRYGQYHGAVKIVYIMKKRGLAPSSVSYNCIIHGLCLNGDCMRAYQLLKEGDNFGYTLPEVTYKALVESLCRENDVANAKDVLEIMLGREIDTETKTRWYNIFLSALHIVQNPSEQLDVLVRMLEKQCQPDTITLNTIIHGFCKVGKINEARKILHDMIDGTFPSCVPDVVTFTMVIHGLLNTGQSDEALDMLRNMVQKHSCAPNTVTYNVIIKGLFDLKKVENALEVFDEMLRKRISCDSLTYTHIIKGLFESDRAEEAKRFWDDIIWPSEKHDEFVYAAMLRGFCRGEKFDQACDFLYKLVDNGVQPGVVNYNILIDYACKKGLKRKAYFILNQMRKNGLEPDAVTWRTLNQLHRGDKLECDNNQEVQDLSANLKVIPDDSLLHCNLDELMEGFVDPSLSTEQVEGACDVPGDASFAKLSKLDTKEPLSRTARRVFGLL
ncbi:pentatricopeptide repeat-containing protein [Carex littledalei]|uniref:Pentatricopeptide repeat-containing protein n=1 Tax=Carex littledalei TaxID=544730 RepID=A0A833QBN8_9POAL|nr:pentatricopeptide repeat-containing protein [Carex littledalei]